MEIEQRRGSVSGDSIVPVVLPDAVYHVLLVIRNDLALRLPKDVCLTFIFRKL